jgi:redox-sensing transcriptional repressor
MSENNQKAAEMKLRTPGDVPTAVIRRLPRYYRFLSDLWREGRARVSSKELAAIMDLTASQIRQDLNCFGGFGQQGYGYNVCFLREKIGEVLGICEDLRAVVIGAGNLGRALVSSHMFERRGVARVAMFDTDPAVIGSTVAGLPVYSADTLYDFCRENRIDIGVITTPKEATESVMATLARAGVLGIWNFSNTEAVAPDPSVTVENMHIGDSLLYLTYEIKKKKDRAAAAAGEQA